MVTQNTTFIGYATQVHSSSFYKGFKDSSTKELKILISLFACNNQNNNYSSVTKTFISSIINNKIKTARQN